MGKMMKNFGIVFVLMMLTLLVVTISTNASTVKGQTMDSLFVYTSVGGTISNGATNLTGGTTHSFPNGQTITLTANPDPGCKFLFWSYASPSGTNTSTDNPFKYNINSAECAIQAMFVPNVNSSISSSSGQTGNAPFAVPISLGGTTSPAAGTYTNYAIGQIVSFTATASNGFKFLYWLVPAASGDAVSILTSNTINFNVTDNACALQPFFAPANSNINVPTIPSVDEFSSIATILVASMLAIVAFGAFRVSRKNK